MNSSRLSQFCDRALEAGWLLGVTITPVFFNVYSDRVFEPDKLTSLRALALLMAVLWLTRFVEERVNGESALRFTLRTPLVLPALLTILIYIISTVFSLVPYISLVGSYQRLQGLHTLMGYLVIFLAMLTSLRTRIQLNRLITVLILNTLPISLYGIIQHNGLDPLPWAGNVTTRVASNMGNAIFIAAYLIMVVPLTGARIVQSFSDILGREIARLSDILRASGYIFILAVELLTIWYARSRGPWLGIVAAGFLFPYLALIILQRQAVAELDEEPRRLSDVLKGFGFGFGSLALAGALGGLAYWSLEGTLAIYVALGLGGLVFGGLWLHFIVERKGWRWLWISWGTVGLAAAMAILIVNIPGPIQTAARKIDSFRRLTTITQLQSGTGKVRALIWEGAVELISVHEPIEFPDGSSDRFNFLRPLVGYGPESMYVAYNSFYPPELGHYESRTASPDRSHNETLDSLVITGILGLAVYLFTFGSFFIWGFRWLGLLTSRRQLLTYLGLNVFFALTFFIIGWQLEGAYLFAVAIPLGMLVGTMAYLTLQALRHLFVGIEAEDTMPSVHPHTMLLVALLAGVIAHFVEINFGIAIAATRTYFWAYAALLVILGLTWLPGRESLIEEDESDDEPSWPRAKRRASSSRRFTRRRSRNALFAPWVAAVLALSLSATFLLGTLAFDFINNPDRLSNAGQIFWRSLTMKYYPEPTRSLGALMIFVFTWLLFGVIGLSELDREGIFEPQRSQRWPTAIAIYAGVSLMGFLIFGGIVSGHQAALTRVQITNVDEIVDVAVMLSGLLGRYYGLIFTLVVAIGLVLMLEGRQPRESGSLAGFSVLVVGVLLCIPAIRSGSYNLIRADIVFKQGKVFANAASANEKQIGIEHYNQSIEYAPREDYYYLFLGKAYLELAQGLPNTTPQEQREGVFLQTEDVLNRARELNPLNTDHSANLARFYKSWAARVAIDLRAEDLGDGDRAALQDKRTELLMRSLENYEIALTLSPNNPIIWNELAQLYAVDLGDQAMYNETIEQSLAVDDEFEQTWMLMGDLRSSRGETEEAIAAYLRALEINDKWREMDFRQRCSVQRVIGTLYAQQNQWDDAADFLEASIADCQPRFNELWEMHRVLAIAYANQGRATAALEEAQVALSLAPEAQQATVQQLIEQLAGSSVTRTITSTTTQP